MEYINVYGRKRKIKIAAKHRQDFFWIIFWNTSMNDLIQLVSLPDEYKKLDQVFLQ